MAPGLLPGAVDAAIAAGSGAVRREGHPVQVFRSRLIVIERSRRGTRVAEGGMRGDVLDPLAVDIDSPPVAQRAEMIRAGLAGLHRHASMDSTATRLYSRGGTIRRRRCRTTSCPRVRARRATAGRR